MEIRETVKDLISTNGKQRDNKSVAKLVEENFLKAT